MTNKIIKKISEFGIRRIDSPTYILFAYLLQEVIMNKQEKKEYMRIYRLNMKV